MVPSPKGSCFWFAHNKDPLNPKPRSLGPATPVGHALELRRRVGPTDATHSAVGPDPLLPHRLDAAQWQTMAHRSRNTANESAETNPHGLSGAVRPGFDNIDNSCQGQKFGARSGMHVDPIPRRAFLQKAGSAAGLLWLNQGQGAALGAREQFPRLQPRDGDGRLGPLIHAPSEPGAWAEWRRELAGWRESTRRRLAYDDGLYRREDLRWASGCFTCGLVMMCDETFHDPASGRFTVEAFLEGGRREFGGYDAIVLWHAYRTVALRFGWLLRHSQFHQEWRRFQVGGLPWSSSIEVANAASTSPRRPRTDCGAGRPSTKRDS